MTSTSVSGGDPSHLEAFSTLEEARHFLQSRMPVFQGAWSDAEIAALIDKLELISKERFEAPMPPGSYPVLVERFRWVIRNDDLALYDCILEGLRGTASAGFFFAVGVSAPAQWGAVVGLVTGLFKLCRSILLRGQQLPPDLFAVLIALKNGGPATIDELTAKLVETNAKWSATDVQTILDTLKSLPMGDGTARPLVAKGHNERWQVSGL